MAIDTARKRRAVAGIPLPGVQNGVLPESIPDAFYRYTLGNNYLPLALPPGGLGGESDLVVLGGRRTRTDDTTLLGG